MNGRGPSSRRPRVAQAKLASVRQSLEAAAVSGGVMSLKDSEGATSKVWIGGLLDRWRGESDVLGV